MRNIAFLKDDIKIDLLDKYSPFKVLLISLMERSIKGYSLVLHDLTEEGSLRVQFAGLGKERRFGCGIFMPHKVISSFE